MKRSSKYRRHQTAYEAPEIEGEFLNESADSILSVSDWRGNLTNQNFGEIDPMLLEEFNEDQGSAKARPVDTVQRATKRPQTSRNSSVYLSARALLDEKRKKSAIAPMQEKADGAFEAVKEKLAEFNVQQVLGDVKKGSIKIKDQLKTQPYLLMLGGAALGFALARIAQSQTNKNS